MQLAISGAHFDKSTADLQELLRKTKLP